MGKKRLMEDPGHWSDIVGMPDNWDEKNITNLINNWKKRKFTFVDKGGKRHIVTGKEWAKAAVQDARRAHAIKQNPTGLKTTGSDLGDVRVATAMPPHLEAEILEAYPTMFRDTKHLNWFMKKFPEFNVRSREYMDRYDRAELRKKRR